MSYLEQKRNALMNSVASGGGIELLDTIEVDTDIKEVTFSNIDTSTYKTLFVHTDITLNPQTTSWLYYKFNGQSFSYNWFDGSSSVGFYAPSTSYPLPMIITKGVSGNVVNSISQAKGQERNIVWEDLTSISFRPDNSNIASGSTLTLYGMKESIC